MVYVGSSPPPYFRLVKQNNSPRGFALAFLGTWRRGDGRWPCCFPAASPGLEGGVFAEPRNGERNKHDMRLFAEVIIIISSIIIIIIIIIMNYYYYYYHHH